MFNFLFDKKEKGAIVALVLAFGAIFLILMGGVLGFILYQLRATEKRVAWNESLQIAEAGIDYYRWCLNNGVEGNCDLEKDYVDSTGAVVGKFSLTSSSRVSCGETIEREISSTGWTTKFPQTKRTIDILYARTSVARFAYLLNDNVWAGEDREIRGTYHSNGGIRMDGENQSVVSSAKDEWICTSSFGCDTCPASDGCEVRDGDCFCPGVFTTTGNAKDGLFDFPVPSFDFNGITIDLAKMKNSANTSGIYLPPSKDIDAQADGYHLIFNNDGTFDVRIITRLWSDWAYNLKDGWHDDYFRIRSEYLYNTYSLNADCPVVFVEDNLWIEGEISEKVAVASANLIDPSKDTSAILTGDIDYVMKDGSDGFVLIAEENILIPAESPDNLELRGIFIAQKGNFGRNHYPGDMKDQLEIVGAIVSNGRVGTQWTSGGIIVSGYTKRENYIDSNLIYSPPVYVPYISPDFRIINWNEVE